MRFEELLQVVQAEPAFETGLLLAGDRDPKDVRRQLSRWVRSGRLHQLRRGLYTLATPYRRVWPHPFLVANHLQPGSYVSCQSAMVYAGLIPEHVPVVTSVGTGRPRRWQTPVGTFEFRHLKRELVKGFRWIEVAADQRAFVATPEKALLDLIYLEPGADAPEYLDALRLQNLEVLDAELLRSLAEEASSPKLLRALTHVADLIEVDRESYEDL